MNFRELKSCQKLILFEIAFVITGLIGFAVFSFAGTDSGPVYNWKTGEIQDDYKFATSMGADWTFVKFISEYEDGTTEEKGLWVPVGEPVVGSREMMLEDMGDDVSSLQTTLNVIRTDDPNDPFYYPQLLVTGKYDQATEAAVYLLEGYYELDQDGVADLAFQSSLYEQVTTPGE